MKRALTAAMFASAAVVLGGCPIYTDSDSTRVCREGSASSGAGCYDCPSGRLTDGCSSWVCRGSGDCPSGWDCNGYDRCEPAGVDGFDGGARADAGIGTTTPCARPSDCPASQTCGADGVCHLADCSTVACPSGYQCTLAGGLARCQAKDGGASTGDAGASCNRDSECASTGTGSKCLNGGCVKPADQCSDSTQCASGSKCVEGVCTPSCATASCPTGYACDTPRGVCSANPTPCSADAECGASKCVAGRCVDRCAGTTCTGGRTCVNGGCIPDQRPTFACNRDGTKAEGVQDECRSGSICLRRSCWITCAPDAGADAGTCQNADAFNVCKSVATSSGTFAVCSTESGLGSQCGPTLGACPSAQICIDGLCR